MFLHGTYVCAMCNVELSLGGGGGELSFWGGKSQGFMTSVSIPARIALL